MIKTEQKISAGPVLAGLKKTRPKEIDPKTLRFLNSARTPGTFVLREDAGAVPYSLIQVADAYDGHNGFLCRHAHHSGTLEDARYLVAAANMLPVLLDEIEAIKKRLDRLEAERVVNEQIHEHLFGVLPDGAGIEENVRIAVIIKALLLRAEREGEQHVHVSYDEIFDADRLGCQVVFGERGVTIQRE